MALPSEVLELPKNDDPVGTYEDVDVAFQLFLAQPPNLFGGFGYHTVTHVGVYGEEYTPALPIALVGIPARSLAQLPGGVEDALLDCEDRDLLSMTADSLEIYLHIHSGLNAQHCQHFACGRLDEFNLMSHAFVFSADGVSDGSHELYATVFMGVFCAEGIEPRHLDFVDGGCAFNGLQRRSQVLHDRRFSPNNGTVGLVPSSTAGCVHFFSVVVDAAIRKAIVTLHVLPRDNDESADEVRRWMRGRNTLGKLLEGLRDHLPAVHAHMMRMLSPWAKGAVEETRR